MKKLLFPLMAILVLTAGCIYVTAPGTPGTQGTTQGTTPTTGQLPTAYIDSITPAAAIPGETITFTGHGTDPNGTVVGYKWRSSVSGDLSSLATFQTASLTAGTHTIYFKVQDNQGNWSDEVSSAVTIASAAPPPTVQPPAINSFFATPGTILSGNTTMLTWNVSNATSVTIDNGIGPVASTGSFPVSPLTSTIYIITATNSLGSVMAATQVSVIASLTPDMPIINSFFASPAVIVKGSSSILSWSVSNAQSVKLDPGFGIVAANGTKTVSPTTTSAYTLTAINPAGWVSQTITVSVFTYIPGLKIVPDVFKIPIIPPPGP